VAQDLEAVLDGVADAVIVQDATGRLTYANEAAVRMLGYRDRDALLAAAPGDVAARFELRGEDGRPFAAARLPGRRVLLGEEPEPVTVRHRPAGGGEWRWARLKARLMRAADGRGALAINVIEDITDLKHAADAQRLLAEAGRVLAGSLDVEDTLRRVARLAVPELADWCMVDLVGERGLERMAAAHADPDQGERAAALHGIVIDPRARVGPAAVARTGRPELHPDVDEAHVNAAALNREHRRALAGLGVRSAISVPMTVRGQRLGVITLSTTAYSGRRLGPEQLAVAEELGRRAAVAVDTARLHRQRSTIARTLQESLLPPHLPEVPGLETGALYRAAGGGTDVGGDFYDLFSVAEEEWIAVIGDVCGKGAEAAAITALARYTIRSAAVRRRSPAAILAWLNDAMLRQEPSGRFCTITCVHLDLARPAIRASVACGGHPPALLVRAGGEVEEVGTPGTLLGLVPDPALQDVRAELAARDTLVLHTDGITEARAPDRVLEPADLHAGLRAARGLPVQRLVEHLGALAVGKEGTPPRDDIAVLALRARG
jgi:PAS domain S-box-containing protein